MRIDPIHNVVLPDLEDGELLPVLWSASSPRAALLEAVPHMALVPGRIHVALATVAPTPHGTVGLRHLTHHLHRESARPFEELLDGAFATMTEGLCVDKGHSDELGCMLFMERDRAPVAAMVAAPGFYERVSEMLHGERRLIVGLPCPDELQVAPANSVVAQRIEEMVMTSTYPATELVPSVLLMEPWGVRVIAERA